MYAHIYDYIHEDFQHSLQSEPGDSIIIGIICFWSQHSSLRNYVDTYLRCISPIFADKDTYETYITS